MHVLVHDYSGHPFEVQLSRALASRGYRVTHTYSASNPTSPAGALSRRVSDPPRLAFAPITLPRPLVKQKFVDRWRLERLYGKKLASRIECLQPDVLLLANTPLDSGLVAHRTCRTMGIPVVYWLQDMIGEASAKILASRLGISGRLIGRHYQRVETRLLRQSAHVVGITDDFRRQVVGKGIPAEHHTTIPNWAPLDEIDLASKDNTWSQSRGLKNKFVFLYSGTLGFKHNPKLLLLLAQSLAEKTDVRVVVNSQGDAAEWLGQQVIEKGLPRLQVNPYQPYETMSDVLGSADVLVCILEPDAGAFSVPSKVLAYHCAGRPLLLAVPRENLAARIVREERTGLVVDPRDEAGFLDAAWRLYLDPAARVQMGARARAYAERTFDIGQIADKFENILRSAVEGGARSKVAHGDRGDR